jgi:hypothetical protein
MSNSRTYNAWKNLRARCKGFQKKSAINYRDRGITYCKEWDNFLNFYRDMGDAPLGMTLDRIDNDKGYSKDNCRWATRTQQQLNQRPLIKSNKSGVKGVCWDAHKGMWLAYFKGQHLGHSHELNECAMLRRKAEEAYVGF